MSSTQPCFCELAPLYVLGLLEEEEQNWVEQQVINMPELAEELAQYEVAATALPYSIAPMDMDGNLKERLFDRLGLTCAEDVPCVAQPIAPKDNPFLTIRFQDIEWQAHPVPGVEVSILHTDSITRRQSGLLKAAPGMHYPLHQHQGVEEIFMMSGDLIISDQVYGAGDYIRSSPGSAHAPRSEHGCMFFFNHSMDDEYFNN